MAPTCCRRSSRSYTLQYGIKVSIIFTVAFIFFLSLPKSGGGTVSLDRRSSDNREEEMIGSKPPVCVNKCKKCRPCMATLVVPDDGQRRKGFKVWSRGEDDTYYLLSWKCTCAHKFFQP